MNTELKRQVMESDEVKEAMYDYYTARTDTKKLMQIRVGMAVNMMACKVLKDGGWSNEAIAEELDITEDSVQMLLAAV